MPTPAYALRDDGVAEIFDGEQMVLHVGRSRITHITAEASGAGLRVHLDSGDVIRGTRVQL